jgi:DNA-binding transcriptional LysR family regulator
MQKTNFTGRDLYLLPALEALLRLRNVTKAADEIGLSQPAMSRVLARLRDIHGDALLVRVKGGLVLTPRAQELLPRMSGVLRSAASIFNPPQFDPRTERRLIRLAASDVQTILLAPRLVARIARDAPGIDLAFEGYRPDLMQRMMNGDVDFAFALANTPLPPGAMSEALAADELSLVMRKGHPAARKRWQVKDYAKHDHVSIAIFGDGRSELDAQLAVHGVTRRIALVTPHFMAALAAVAKSDLVTTVSKRFALAFADSLGLVLKKPPLQEIALHPTLVWSQVRDGDPLLQWMRKVVREVSLDALKTGV